MSPRRTREQPRQNNAKTDHGDFASLEQELHNSRQNRHAARSAQRAEAESISRVTNRHFRSRPVA